MPMLKIGQKLMTKDGNALMVERFLASGGQGEVYEVSINQNKYALKWYFYPTTPAQVVQAQEQRQAFDVGSPFSMAPPDSRFLWPITLVEDPKKRTFGYLMDLLPSNFQGLEKLVLGKMRPAPNFHVLCNAAINLADCFRKLHNQGLCYKDINLGGPFLDPKTGDIIICDCDNVRYNKTPGNIIFIFFAAPELILNEDTCNRKTDWYSLAILLFYMFVRHHPLDGKRQLQINVFNEVAQKEFYGKDPLFIFNPDDQRNAAVIGFHDNALRNWNLYPKFLQRLFTRAFTLGIQNPDERVKEGEWMSAFSRLRDSLYYCSHCATPNFYDFERFQQGHHQHCWKCKQESILPMRITIGDRNILCNHHACLYPHHIGTRLDFSKPVAQITQHPHNPGKWGLLNCSDMDWTCVSAEGKALTVPKNRSLPLKHGLKINFGTIEGMMLSR